MTLRSRAAQVKALEKSRDVKRSKYGNLAVSLGNERYREDAIPSPSWMLDYKTGTGGFPLGHLTEVFGANTLGKSSAIAYPTIRNVQLEGKLPALIATEPAFDPTWVTRLGVDPELLLLQRPLHAEEAFEMLHDLVYENLVDFIVLDSLGALGSASETTAEGEKQKDFKKKAFGISGVTTSGLNAIIPRMWRNNIGLLILNQQRQDTKSRTAPGMGMQYDSPGGEALHHDAVLRIQLKPGKNRYTDKLEGEEVLAGRELVCQFKKNKMSTNAKAAKFDFYYVATPKFDNKLGVDVVEDIVRACKVAGVIKGGAYLEHHAFPKGKVHGKPGLAKLLEDQPEVRQILRSELMAKMRDEQATVELPSKPPQLEVVSND